jgi:prepilin-type N-terminal cleavage/methylation domain-containing protein
MLVWQLADWLGDPSRMLTGTDTPRDSGFTLIELLVAMIIVLVLLAAFTSFLVGSFTNSEKAIDEGSAIQQVTKSMTMFSADLQKAKSPDREETQLGDPGMLSDALLNGGTLQNVNNANATVSLDVADIITATSTRLTFRSDALDRPGTECVTYYVTAGTPALMREIYAYDNNTHQCTGAALVKDQLIQQVR